MRIAIIGPQNTGKSTFLADLMEQYPDYVTPTETYRDLVIKKGLKINQETGEESQRAIRDFLYDQVRTETRPNVFFDRTLIDNYVYTALACERGVVSEGLRSVTERMMFESLALLDRLFFVPTAVSVPLHDDLLRDIDVAFIDATNRMFVTTLLDVARHHEIPIDVISGTRTERVAVARKIMS